MLAEPDINWGPRPFRVQNEWVDNKGLRVGVRDVWSKYKGGGSYSINILRKSKAMKQYMRAWAREKSMSGDNIKILEKDLSDIEKKATITGWSEELRHE